MENPLPGRRQFLSQAGGGAGMIALASLLAEQAIADPVDAGPLAARPTSFPPRARRVIWLFMHGGPSHVDLFDPKPELVRYAGQPVPESFGKVMTRRDVAKNPLMGPVRPFRPRGESGLEISDFLPQMAGHADKLCVVRSMHGDSVNHPQSVYQMNTGSILMGRPSVGSWVAYGLGTENQNMPAFVVLPDPRGGIKGGPPAWGSGFLPATYQGVMMRAGKIPILDLVPQQQISRAEQQSINRLLGRFNQEHLRRRANDDELSARIHAYELAFRMQSEAPRLVDLSEETEETLKLYGADREPTRDFGQRCLLARRMVERGVRFVQLYSGDIGGWDAHKDVAQNHGSYCQKTDRPVAGLLEDLHRRGLLDDTLVIWGGEFGRMPMSEQGTGRDHNPWGYSIWMAGAGIRGGRAVGASDPIGLRAAEGKVHVRDFHATLLHLIGVDHQELSFFQNGLDQRLTGPDEAQVVDAIIS